MSHRRSGIAMHGSLSAMHGVLARAALLRLVVVVPFFAAVGIFHQLALRQRRLFSSASDAITICLVLVGLVVVSWFAFDLLILLWHRCRTVPRLLRNLRERGGFSAPASSPTSSPAPCPLGDACPDESLDHNRARHPGTLLAKAPLRGDLWGEMVLLEGDSEPASPLPTVKEMESLLARARADGDYSSLVADVLGRTIRHPPRSDLSAITGCATGRPTCRWRLEGHTIVPLKVYDELHAFFDHFVCRVRLDARSRLWIKGPWPFCFPHRFFCNGDDVFDAQFGGLCLGRGSVYLRGLPNLFVNATTSPHPHGGVTPLRLHASKDRRSEEDRAARRAAEDAIRDWCGNDIPSAEGVFWRIGDGGSEMEEEEEEEEEETEEEETEEEETEEEETEHDRCKRGHWERHWERTCAERLERLTSLALERGCPPHLLRDAGLPGNDEEFAAAFPLKMTKSAARQQPPGPQPSSFLPPHVPSMSPTRL